MIKENFLQFVWMHQLYLPRSMRIVNEESLKIIDVGSMNQDSGPDFFNACIEIGGVKWVGNVEIHINSSDWKKHQHHKDKAYNNVILHVVLKNDEDVKRENGELVPTVEIKIDDSLVNLHKQLLQELNWPACKNYLGDVPDIYWSLWLNRMMVERLQLKAGQVKHLLKELNNNWEQCFFIHLLKYFGLNVNNLPFELLGRKTPINAIYRQKGNLFQIEALLFGQSGLLNNVLLGDDYFLQLREEYHHLRKKYNLNGIEPHVWKFLRMRPSNFPTLRIAQLAGIINKSNDLLNDVISADRIEDFQKMLAIRASKYWETHYVFNKVSKRSHKTLGQSSIDTIIINGIIPFIYVYGEINSKPEMKERALRFLEDMSPENNKVLKQWQKLGRNPKNAFESQALLQLKNVYCDHKRCISCQIGAKIYLHRIS